MIACIAEPISWPRLEGYAAGARDPQIRDHLAACSACARCLAEIEADVVALPVLAVPTAALRRPPRRWLWTLAPALAAAAVVLVVLLRRSPVDPSTEEGDVAIRVPNVKGGFDVIVNLVRERGGAVRTDVRTYAPGDRWKLQVTCPPGFGTWLDVAIVDGDELAYPLPPARVACGNNVLLPGAFTITGDRPNRICARIAPDGPPDRGDAGSACVTVRRE